MPRIPAGLAFLAAGLALAGCARRDHLRQQAAVAGAAAPAAAPAGVSISLDRGACHGSCPIYRVTIAGDGAVVFQGEANVQQMGRATGQVPRDSVLALIAEFDRAGYDRLSDRYVMGTAGCGRYATDLPTVTLALARDGRTKRVEHDQGCRGAPAAIALLARRVDEVAGSQRWIGERR